MTRVGRPRRQSMSDPDTSNESSRLVKAIEALTAEVAQLREVLARSPVARPTAKHPVEPSASIAKQPAVAASAVSQAGPEQVAIQTALDQLLVQLFSTGLDGDDEDGFEAFLALIHSDRTDAPNAKNNLRAFTWKSFRKNVGTYLKDSADPSSFTIERRDPKVLAPDTTMVKLFLAGTRPSATPVTFRVDDNAAGYWRINDSSL